MSLAKKLTIFDGISYRDIAHHFDATLSHMNIFWTLHDDEDIDEERKYRAVKRFFMTRPETKPDRWRKRAASRSTKYKQEHGCGTATRRSLKIVFRTWNCKLRAANKLQ